MADVTIYGAGIIGLSAAWAALDRGAQVTVVDPNGVAHGASGGLVGALAPHTPENWNPKKQMQFECLDGAEAFWREIEAVGGGESGYARVGRIQPVLDDNAKELAERRAVSAETLWQGRYTWQVQSAGTWAHLLQVESGLVIYDSLSARLHPRKATEALALAVHARGGRIVSAPPEEKSIEIWATGAAGLRDLSADLGASVGNGVKGQAALLQADLGDAPQIYADGLHIVPHADGTAAVGSTSERDYAAPDTTDDLLDDVIARARTHCPALADAPVLERWAGERPRARSRAPMIGPHQTRPNAFVANGGFKIGFGMAQRIADLVTDLALLGKDEVPADFQLRASYPKALLGGE